MATSRTEGRVLVGHGTLNNHSKLKRAHIPFLQFQLFCGIIGYEAIPVIRKFQDEDEAMDEDDSDEDPSGPKFTGPQSPQPITIQEYDPARHYIRTSPIFTEDEEEREAKRLRNFEEKERRLDNFLRNPETSIKIFFSSYFREKGWMWCVYQSISV